MFIILSPPGHFVTRGGTSGQRICHVNSQMQQSSRFLLWQPKAPRAPHVRGANPRWSTKATNYGFDAQGSDRQVIDVLREVAKGLVSPEKALTSLSEIKGGQVEVHDFAKVDIEREERTGYPEVVYGEGKTPEQIADILKVLSKKHGRSMATRVSPDAALMVKGKLPEVEYHQVARILTLGLSFSERGSETNGAMANSTFSAVEGTVAVVSAGTCDLPVAEEATVTASVMGLRVIKIIDVGVAGLHRLISQIPKLRSTDVVIVVAGMDGALPSVVTGLVDCPVIAVPTSVGYGAAFGGVAPLLSMLNSCSSGLTVVNIDNGFGAAMAAARILKQIQKSRHPEEIANA